MGRAPHWLCFVLLCLCAACSQPPAPASTPKTASVPAYSAGSIAPDGAQDRAPLAPGRIFSIYGEHLGPAQPCQGTADPDRRQTPNPLRPHQTLIETQVFPTRLCDTEVQVGGVAAGLLYVSAGQINFQVPQTVPTKGEIELRVIHGGVSGPAVSLPLTVAGAGGSTEAIAAKMWSELQRVRWQQPFEGHRSSDCAAVAPSQSLHGGLNGHAYLCAAIENDVTVESFYYPVGAKDPGLLLLRADVRPVNPYPEQSAEVEQWLVRRLTREYGPGIQPGNVYELGAGGREPGLSWHTGQLTLFLHRNRNHAPGAGVRLGVILIAVREELMRQRAAPEPAPESPVLSELREYLGESLLSTQREFPKSEEDRVKAEQKMRAALLRWLRDRSGDRNRRAAALMAADELAVRLGGLLVARSYTPGAGEHLFVAEGAGKARMQLAAYGVRYGESIGHYSGDLEYDRSLLQRAWAEYPETRWGQRAFLMLQRLGCATPRFACNGPNCFRAVIEQGERFLRDYPDTPFRAQQLHHLALAYETWWSLGQANSGDITAYGARVTRASAEAARQHAIELYEQLWTAAPESPEGRAAELALPRLKLKLDTFERTFFCFSC